MALSPLAEKDLLVILPSKHDSQTGREPTLSSLKGPSFVSLLILSRLIWPSLRCHRYVSLSLDTLGFLLVLRFATLNISVFKMKDYIGLKI